MVITKTANVSGNIFAPRISIDNGATFNGKIEMQRTRGAKSSEQPEDQAADEPVVEKTLEMVVPSKKAGAASQIPRPVATAGAGQRPFPILDA